MVISFKPLAVNEDQDPTIENLDVFINGEFVGSLTPENSKLAQRTFKIRAEGGNNVVALKENGKDKDKKKGIKITHAPIFIF